MVRENGAHDGHEIGKARIDRMKNDSNKREDQKGSREQAIVFSEPVYKKYYHVVAPAIEDDAYDNLPVAIDRPDVFLIEPESKVDGKVY